MEVQCLDYERHSIGQIIKLTKILYMWRLNVGEQRHEITLRESLLSGKVRVSLNGKEMFHRKMENQQKEFGFGLPSEQFKSIEFRKVSPEFELRINGCQFQKGSKISLKVEESSNRNSFPIVLNDNRLSPSPSPESRRQQLSNQSHTKALFTSSDKNVQTFKSEFEKLPEALKHDEYGLNRPKKPSLFGLSDEGSRGSRISGHGQARSQNKLPNPSNSNLFGEPVHNIQVSFQNSVSNRQSKMATSTIGENNKANTGLEPVPLKYPIPQNQIQQSLENHPQKPNLTLSKLVRENSFTSNPAAVSPISNVQPGTQFHSANSRLYDKPHSSHFSPLMPPTVHQTTFAKPRELMYPNPYPIEVPNIFKLKAI